MGDEAFDRQADPLRAAQEIVGDRVFVDRVDPGSDDGDFLRADILVRVDRAGAVVHEESDLADASAALDVFPDVAGRRGNPGALECKVGAASAGRCADRSGDPLDPIMQFVVDRRLRTHPPSHVEAAFVAVEGDDVLDTGCAHSGEHEKADRAAALHQDAAAEVQKARAFRALQRVNDDGRRLDEHPEVEAEVVDHEKRRVRAHDHMLGEIPVEVRVVVGDEAVDAEVFAQIEARGRVEAGVAFAAGADARHNPVAQPHRLSAAVTRHIFSKGDDLSGALVPENKGREFHRVTAEFMDIGSANPAAFDPDQNLVVADFPDREFADLDFSGSGEDGRTADRGKAACRDCRGGSRRLRRRMRFGGLFCEDFADDAADFFSLDHGFVRDNIGFIAGLFAA